MKKCKKNKKYSFSKNLFLKRNVAIEFITQNKKKIESLFLLKTGLPTM